MRKTIYDKSKWEPEYLRTTESVLEKIESIQKNSAKWAFRGQPGEYGELIPSLDRLFLNCSFSNILEERTIKTRFESQSVELFRRTLLANITSEEEKQLDYVCSLGLLQHYDGVTRLLDWSFSPFTALYFAMSCKDDQGGEIWSFDYGHYLKRAPDQWYKYPAMKNNDWSNAFEKKSTDDWFVCEHWLGNKFPRLYAQDGFFSMTSQFGRDHSIEIANLFQLTETFHLYLIDKKCKFELRRYLKEKLNIWHGSIYPDITGAGAGIKEVLQDQANLIGNKKNDKRKRRKSDYYLNGNISRFLRI